MKRVIDVSGGRVTVASQLGRGTTFLVYFPLVASAPVEAAADPLFRKPAVR